MANDYCMQLNPHEWVQSLTNYPSTGIEGRRLMVNAKVESDNEINLSTGEDLSQFNVNLLIFDVEPAKIYKGPLENAFGLLIYYPSHDAQDAFIGGWFCVKPDDYNELWYQIRQGGYADCSMSLDVGPVIFEGHDWVWNVAQQRALFISTFTVDFQRLVTAEKKGDDQRARRGVLSK